MFSSATSGDVTVGRRKKNPLKVNKLPKAVGPKISSANSISLKKKLGVK